MTTAESSTKQVIESDGFIFDQRATCGLGQSDFYDVRGAQVFEVYGYGMCDFIEAWQDDQHRMMMRLRQRGTGVSLIEHAKRCTPRPDVQGVRHV